MIMSVSKYNYGGSVLNITVVVCRDDCWYCGRDDNWLHLVKCVPNKS